MSVEDRDIPLEHSDRSKTPIEPYLSDQWFVQDGRRWPQTAMDAVDDGRVKFFPERYAKTYLDWLGEKRDWCISRQLWWGHRIPIWYCDTSCTEAELLKSALRRPRRRCRWRPRAKNRAAGSICSEIDLCCVDCARDRAHRSMQDDDVLDTWFSSALWPHSTLGWPRASTPEPAPYFYPTSVLVTSRDIITLWVARMVITGLYNMGDVPFRHVYIHPKMLDGFGETMTKRKGNGVDPLDIIDNYGTDAVRFTIASFAGENQDVRLPVGNECPHCGDADPADARASKAVPRGGAKPRVTCPKCKKPSQYSSPWYEPDAGEPVARDRQRAVRIGRNFCNKLWNAARFVMMNLEGYTPAAVSPRRSPARRPLDPEPAGDDRHGRTDGATRPTTSSTRPRGRCAISPGTSSATGTSR